MDRSPAEVVATLLERTMYRVLASEVPVQERRAQRTHPEYKKPELMATAPNQVWSWDITRLLGPEEVELLLPLRDPGHLQPLRRGLDGGGINSALAGRLIQQSCLKHGVQDPDAALRSDDEPMHGLSYSPSPAR